MPRWFDFDNKDADARRKAYEDGQTFPYLLEKRTGKNEIDLRDIHGPHGLFLFDGENHQFKRVVNDKTGYRNEPADEIFEWLDANLQGRWHWMEMSSNHGHSVSTNIWVEDDAEAKALFDAFPSKLMFDEKQHAENQKIREQIKISETGLHPSMSAGRLSYMIEWNDDESRRYIADIGDKPGFAKMFAGSIGALRTRGRIDENDLLDRLADILDNVIPATGRDQVLAYLSPNRTPFVEAMLERLTASSSPAP
jgi:hypothetical protein